jgi:hypothetical protein
MFRRHIDGGAPEPSASILAKESRVFAASCDGPFEPTQIAPESRTMGKSAAARPPASGSSGLARATRLETTTTLMELTSLPAGPSTVSAALCSDL